MGFGFSGIYSLYVLLKFFKILDYVLSMTVPPFKTTAAISMVSFTFFTDFRLSKIKRKNGNYFTQVN